MIRHHIHWIVFAVACCALLSGAVVWYATGADHATPSTHAAPSVVRSPRQIRISDKPRSHSVPPRAVELADSGVVADWSNLERKERIDIVLQTFEDNLEDAETDPRMLDAAASALSVLRAELILEDGDRLRYDALEARYDAVAEAGETG